MLNTHPPQMGGFFMENRETYQEINFDYLKMRRTVIVRSEMVVKKETDAINQAIEVYKQKGTKEITKATKRADACRCRNCIEAAIRIGDWYFESIPVEEVNDPENKNIGTAKLLFPIPTEGYVCEDSTELNRAINFMEIFSTPGTGTDYPFGRLILGEDSKG